MPPDDIEKLLKSVPVRTLSPAAEDEIVRNLRTAAARPPWWRSPIPLWQAAAACLAIALITGGVIEFSRDARSMENTRPAPSVATNQASSRNTVFVELNPPLFPEPAATADRLDISTWTFVRSE